MKDFDWGPICFSVVMVLIIGIVIFCICAG